MTKETVATITATKTSDTEIALTGEIGDSTTTAVVGYRDRENNPWVLTHRITPGAVTRTSGFPSFARAFASFAELTIGGAKTPKPRKAKKDKAKKAEGAAIPRIR